MQSFQSIQNWRDEFLYYADVGDKDAFPFVLIGNKLDIEPERREVTEEVVLDWCNENGHLPFIQTSAKEATNVQLAFTSALHRWNKLEAKLEKPYSPQTINLNEGSLERSRSHEERQSCCLTL